MRKSIIQYYLQTLNLDPFIRMIVKYDYYPLQGHISYGTPNVRDFSILPDGRLAIKTTGGGSLILNLVTKKTDFAANYSSENLKLLSDGRIVGSDMNELIIWDKNFKKKVIQFSESKINRIAILPNDQIITVHGDGSLCITDEKESRFIMSVDPFTPIIILPNNRFMVRNFEGAYEVINFDIIENTFWMPESIIGLLPNGLLAFLTKTDIEVWDLNKDRRIYTLPSRNMEDGIVVGDLIVIRLESSHLLVWKPGNEKPEFIIRANRGIINKMVALLEDRLLVVTRDSMEVWNLRTRSLEKIFNISDVENVKVFSDGLLGYIANNKLFIME